MWHHTGGKSLDFTPGMILQPLLGYQLRFYSCAGGASVPLWSMETACQQTEEYKGKRPRWRVLWPLPGDFGFKAPRRLGSPNTESRPSVSGRDSERSRDRMSERWLLKKAALGGQTATGAGRASVPPLSLS